MKRFNLFLFCFPFFLTNLCSQIHSEIDKKLEELTTLKKQEEVIEEEIIQLKLKASFESLSKYGYPVSKTKLSVLEHSAMVIGYDCKYQLASWTFHQITPDVVNGKVSRTNDFRTDPKAPCTTASDADYFTKTTQADGTTKYNGFGYDRGHLSPSADFKWSKQALSESYFYSNMTPQHPAFNRESWASLENYIRRVSNNENKSYYIITGPILHDKLLKIKQGENQLSIPEWHYKIVVDDSKETPRGIVFLMPNEKCDKDLSKYVITIDSLEKLTQINFFPNFTKDQEKYIEGFADFYAWKGKLSEGDVVPIHPLDLPKGHFNTLQAASKDGQKVKIVGKVVSARLIDKSQATFINLDRQFPNQIFTITIWKDARANFSYRPEKDLENQYIVVEGTVTVDKKGIPTINVENEKQIQLLTDDY